MGTGEALVAVCRAIERSEYGSAERLLGELPAEAVGESAVLRGLLARRKASPGESWTKSLLNAWESAGFPKTFEFLEREAPLEAIERLSKSLLERREPPEDLLTSPLVGLLSAGWKPGGADAVARQAMDASARDGSLEHQLWIAALLSSNFMSFDVARAAGRHVRRMRRDLARNYPNDFTFVASALLDEEDSSGSPLTGELVRDLAEAIARHTPAVRLGDLYASICRARRAQSSAERAAALQDAVMMMPFPLLTLKMRADATLELDHAPRAQLGALLCSVCGVFGGSGVAAERLMGLALGEVGARALGDGKEQSRIKAELTWLRTMSAGKHRLPLEWPIEPLRCELIDEVARDECGLFKLTEYDAE